MRHGSEVSAEAGGGSAVAWWGTSDRSTRFARRTVLAIAAALLNVLDSCVITPSGGISSPFGTSDTLLELTRATAAAQERGDLEQALALAEETVRYTLDRYGTDHYLYGIALTNRGGVLEQLGRYAAALSSAGDAVAVLASWRGRQDQHYVQAVLTLALVQERLGNQRLADEWAQQALDLSPPDSLESARALFIHGASFGNRGDSEGAIPLLDRSLQIALARGEVRSVAPIASALAQACLDSGRFDNARRAIEVAFNASRSLGPRTASEGWLEEVRSDLARREGRYEEAEVAARRSVEILQEVFGASHPRVGRPLLHLATVQLALGLWDRAFANVARARELIRRWEGTPMDAAGARYTLGQISYGQRDYDATLVEARAALAVLAPRLGPCPAVAAIRVLIAAALLAKGQIDQAEHELREALPYVGSTERVHPLMLLARIHQVRGRWVQARTLLDDASHDPSMRPGGTPMTRMELATQRAILALGTGDHAAATLPVRDALGLAETAFRNASVVSTESRLEAFTALVNRTKRAALELARLRRGDPTAARLGLAATLLGKGRLLDHAALANRLAQQSSDPADRARFERLQLLQRRVALASLGVGEGGAGDDRQVAGLWAQAEELAEQINRRRPSGVGGVLPSPDTVVDRVAERLRAGTALVEFVEYETFDLQSPNEDALGEPRCLAMVLRADGNITVVDLGPTAAIQQSVGELLAVLSLPTSAPEAAARDLYQRVLAPLEQALEGASHLLIAPDGQLNLVPFAALHDGSRYAADRWTFTYLGSGRDLLRNSPAGQADGETVLLGDPQFPDFRRQPASADACALPSFEAPPLPGTRQEVTRIGAMFPGARVLVGERATDSAFLALSHPRILHVATHGYVAADLQSSTGTRAVVMVRTDPSRTEAATPTCNPLLRSAILLARSTDRGAYSDGIATALEVSGMDLWGTRLVVLSTCDSGRGDVRAGQGVYGLRRALFAAGAETIVASLWPVDDDSSRDLMVEYYRALVCRQGRSEALQSASNVVRRHYPHPYHWAPFIAIGQEAALPLEGAGGSAGCPPQH